MTISLQQHFIFYHKKLYRKGNYIEQENIYIFSVTGSSKSMLPTQCQASSHVAPPPSCPSSRCYSRPPLYKVHLLVSSVAWALRPLASSNPRCSHPYLYKLYLLFLVVDLRPLDVHLCI